MDGSSAHGNGQIWARSRAGPDGRIYAIGGNDPVSGPLATVEAYDPESNAWATVAPMPTARSALAAAAGADGRIYAIGGDGGLKSMEAYDPRTNAWSAVAPMPSGRSLHAAVTGFDGRIFAIGGMNLDEGPLFHTNVDVYDPSRGTWTTVGPMPFASGGLAAAADSHGRAYAFGGFNDTGAAGAGHSGAHSYEPKKNVWKVIAALPTSRDMAAATTGPDGRIYVVGGMNNYNIVDIVEAYTPHRRS